MPANSKEIAVISKKTIEGIILTGAGFLLIVVGVLSKVPLTRFFAIGLGAFIFYAVYGMFRKDSTEHVVESKIVDEGFENDVRYEEREEYFEEVKSQREKHKNNRTSNPISAPVKNVSSVTTANPEPPKNVNEPKDEFNGTLFNILQIIKEVTFAHTAAFFWVNRENATLVVEVKLTDSGSFVGERKLPFSNDLVSQIALSGEPQIVNQISADAEKDILRYYTSLQDVKSFVGVPVFYSTRTTTDAPIGIIIVDSKAEDAFGEETFAQLSHFANLLSSLLTSFTEKFDLQYDATLLMSASSLRHRIKGSVSLAGMMNALMDETEQLLPWDSLSVVVFDERQTQWVIAAVRVRGSFSFVASKQMVDLEESIVGNCLRNSSSIIIGDLLKNNRSVFYPTEPKSELLSGGSLMIVPFVSNEKCFGAIAATSHKRNIFSKKELAGIELLTSIIGSSLEVLELNSIISEHVVVDEQTGVLTKKYFLSRLEEELHRANDRGEDFSLVLVGLSNLNDIEQRYGVESKIAALHSVALQLRANVRAYDVVARFDETTLAIALGDTTANDAFLWAEKLRSTIASNIITSTKKNFSVAVTIGITGATNNAQSADLVKNASHILEQAKKAGGNIVRVF